MNVALRKPMSVAEFLAWETRQELRFEFDGFAPVAMTGGTIAHDLITFNVRKALDARLGGKPCTPHGPNVKIVTAGKVRYPTPSSPACRSTRTPQPSIAPWSCSKW